MLAILLGEPRASQGSAARNPHTERGLSPRVLPWLVLIEPIGKQIGKHALDGQREVDP